MIEAANKGVQKLIKFVLLCGVLYGVYTFAKNNPDAFTQLASKAGEGLLTLAGLLIDGLVYMVQSF